MSFLTLAWPIGSDFRGGEDGEDAARSYVRDPEGVLAGDFGVPPPDLPLLCRVMRAIPAITGATGNCG